MHFCRFQRFSGFAEIEHMIEWKISADELEWANRFFGSASSPLAVHNQELEGFSENAVCQLPLSVQ
jgi:hypothetical protein